MEEKKGIFTIVNEEGQEVECEILFTFESEETKKNYETEKEWKVIETILTSVQQKIEEASSSNK